MLDELVLVLKYGVKGRSGFTKEEGHHGISGQAGGSSHAAPSTEKDSIRERMESTESALYGNFNEHEYVNFGSLHDVRFGDVRGMPVVQKTMLESKARMVNNNILMYQVAKKLGWDVVPPTVKVGDKLRSEFLPDINLWENVAGKYRGMHDIDPNNLPPELNTERGIQSLHQAAVLDEMLGQTDRHSSNFGINNGLISLIDNDKLGEIPPDASKSALGFKELGGKLCGKPIREDVLNDLAEFRHSPDLKQFIPLMNAATRKNSAGVLSRIDYMLESKRFPNPE